MIDPRCVPFTYVTGHGPIVVRKPGVVELTFTAEHLTVSEGNDESPVPVVEARLVMPLGEAASLGSALAKIAADQIAPERGSEGPPQDGQIELGLLMGAFAQVLRQTLAHVDTSRPWADRVADTKRDLVAVIKAAQFEGASMTSEVDWMNTAIIAVEAMVDQWVPP